VILARTNVNTTLTTVNSKRARVIYTRRVWFWPEWVWLWHSRMWLRNTQVYALNLHWLLTKTRGLRGRVTLCVKTKVINFISLKKAPPPKDFDPDPLLCDAFKSVIGHKFYWPNHFHIRWWCRCDEKIILTNIAVIVPMPNYAIYLAITAG
jgi:hypothetical protein